MKKTLLLTALVSASAFAQEVSPPPPPPPPPPPQQQMYAPPPPSQPAMDAPLEDPGGRVRWGVSGNLGWHAPQSAFTIGAEGRIGYQVSNMFAAYAVVGATAGFGIGAQVSVSGASASITALSYYYLGAIAELMFADLFYVGGGPVIANGGLVGVSGSATSSGNSEAIAIAHVGAMPGLDLRLGLGFGRARAPSFRRGGFNLGIDALILFHPNAVVIREKVVNGTGTGSVRTNELAVTVTPMLTLGYDAR